MNMRYIKEGFYLVSKADAEEACDGLPLPRVGCKKAVEIDGITWTLYAVRQPSGKIAYMIKKQ